MSENKAWYDTGYEGIKREEERLQSLSGPMRFWMPPEASKQVIFLDDEPFSVYEHNPKLNGSWQHQFTCLQGVYDNPICCSKLKDYPRYYVGYFTIVDCTEWTDKKGNKYQYDLKLFPAKIRTLKKLRRKKEERGSLIGCLYKATREDSTSPVVGDEFEFVREVDLDKVFEVARYKGKLLSELWTKAEAGGEDGISALKRIFQVQIKEGRVVPSLVPYNYFTLLEPKSPKDIEELLGSCVIDAVDARADKTVPF
jgi:hypothetical protein